MKNIALSMLFLISVLAGNYISAQSPCTGTYTGSPIVVDATGYNCSFETTFGNGYCTSTCGSQIFEGWGSCSVNTGRHWNDYSGSTSSSSTGPSSAQDGSRYIYCETSSSGYNMDFKVGQTVDLSLMTTANLSFYRHLYGSHIGTLKMFVDGVQVGSWSGSQNAWLSADVNLTPYCGSTILVEFVYRSGTYWRSDAAIDNISITGTGSTGGPGGPGGPAPCAYLLPHTEAFPVNGQIPTGYSMTAATGDGWKFTSTPGYASSSNGRTTGTYTWIDFSGTDVAATLTGPEVCVGTASAVQLEFSFWSVLGTYTLSGAYNQLYVEQYDGSSWSTVAMFQENNTGWVTKTVGITPYNNGTEDVVKVRFRGETGGAGNDFYNDILIDDINMTASTACTGAPNAGTASKSATSGCNGNSITLTSSGLSSGGGITYQWQQNTGSSWSNISGETATSATVTPTTSTQYRIVSTCPASGQSSNSSSSGTYTVDNCFVVPFSGNNTVTTCTGTIYDHAGSTGSYSNNANGYTTIMPATSGAKVQVSGNRNMEGCCDYLYIYNGTLASGTPLWSGNSNGAIPTVTSTHSTGALTIKFTSDGSVTYGGFDLAIACALPCSGTPSGGTGVISSATGCPSVSVNLSATGVSTLGGITYQWQQSSSSTGPFTNVSGANLTTLSVSPATPTYYRLRSTCSNGNGQGYSSVVSRIPATFTPGSGNGNCGTGTVTLTGTATGGSVTWYTAASGGSSIGTGNSYTTPSISQTTTYYASSSGCPSSRAAITASIWTPPTVDAGTGLTYCNGNSGTLTGTASAANVSATLGAPLGTSNGSNGAYFNLVNTSGSNIVIKGFWQENTTYTGTRTMNVYYYPGTYLSGGFSATGSITSVASGWSQVATSVSITLSNTLQSAGAYIPITPVTIPAGSTYGFYVGGNTSVRYWTSTGTPGTTAYTSNSDLKRTVGHGGNYGSAMNKPRSAHVTVDYEIPASVASTAWTPSTGLSSTSNLSTTASPSTNTQYTLTAIDANGCQSQDVVDVTVNALPTINATPAARCDNGTVNLGAAPSSGTTVNWYSSATSTSSVGTGALFTTPSLSSTTTYYAAATSPEGCITSPRESITATINALPNANGGPDKTGVAQCGLEAISLSGTNTSGASGQWSVQSGPNGLFADPTDPTTTFTPASYGGTTLARWTTTSGAGCDGTDDVEIQFSQPNTGPLSSINPQAGDLVWGGMTNSAWSTSANWYQYQSGGYWKRMTSGEPSSTDMVYIIPNSTGGMCVSSGNNATPASNESVEDLRVMSGATLNLNNGSLNVYGDIVNDGTVNPGSATVKMMGSGNQTISGTGTSTFDKLTIDKSSGDVIIAQPVTVEGTLKMTSGDIDNSSLLTLGSTAGSGNLNYAAGHIKGAFRRYFPNSTGSELLFPMKKGSMEREGKITFTQAPGPDQYLTVELKTGAPAMANNYNGLPFYASDNQLIQVYSNEGYLEIDPTAGNYNSSINSAQYTLKMHAKNMSGVNNASTVRLIKSPGPSHTTWVPCGNHANVSTTNVNDFWVTSITSTGFSFFGFGSNNDNPLPVELVSFNGNCGDGVVELNWTTASEHNSAYFQLEKSRDGENWDVINTQDAAGNSNEMRSYSFVDAHASAGNNLYRLSQFDIDGDSKTYSVVNVNCAAPNAGYFSTHPNPSTGEFHVVLNNQELIGTATIRMVDSRGTIVSQKEIEVMEGINVYNFNEFKVAPGMYYITVVNEDKSTETIKQSIK